MGAALTEVAEVLVIAVFTLSVLSSTTSVSPLEIDFYSNNK
jgi:hypothetical protein